jgi:hypothetical protein
MVIEFPLWMLTGVKWTPWVCVSGLTEAHPILARRQHGGTRANGVVQCQVGAGASGLDLCTSAEQVDHWRVDDASLKVGHVAKIPRSDARLGAADRSDRRIRSARVMLCVEPNGYISWGSYLSPLAGSCSLSWPFLLRIHPSEPSHSSLTHPRFIHHLVILKSIQVYCFE